MPKKHAQTPCIITVAITGSVPRKENNPAVPITVSEQIESTHAAFEAGAALVHVHVRNDDRVHHVEPGQVRGRSRSASARSAPASSCSSPPAAARASGSERGGMLHLRPDMASLSTGSCNFPTRVYENPPELIHELAAARCSEYDVKPEIEVFDLAMLYNAVNYVRDGVHQGAAARAVRARA